MDPSELEVESLVKPCASEEFFAKNHEVLKSVVANGEEAKRLVENNCIPKVPNEMGQPHEVLWSGMACPALAVPEVTANTPVPEVPNEMGQLHEVLWLGMACSALGVPEVATYRCNFPNSDSLRVINPNGLDPPLKSEITNGLDPPHQESNKDR